MQEHSPSNFVHWWFDPRDGAPGRLAPRWIFLRALAAIYFSAFYSLLFQIKGLIGPGASSGARLSRRRCPAVSLHQALVCTNAVLVLLEFTCAHGCFRIGLVASSWRF